jgi:hypothetical protein
MPFEITRTAKLPAQKKKIIRLGDRIAVVAEPIKQAGIKYGSKWIKNRLENCNCHKRKEFLNNLLP